MIGEIAIQSAIGFFLAGAVLTIVFYEWRIHTKYYHVDEIALDEFIRDSTPEDLIEYNVGVCDGWRKPFKGVLSINPITREPSSLFCEKDTSDWRGELEKLSDCDGGSGDEV